jgi:two-component system phosphate regulon response regulator OmpR
MARVVVPISDDAPHVLVVDDDSRIRSLLSRFLQTNGYRVTTASACAERRASTCWGWPSICWCWM